MTTHGCVSSLFAPELASEPIHKLTHRVLPILQSLTDACSPSTWIGAAAIKHLTELSDLQDGLVLASCHHEHVQITLICTLLLSSQAPTSKSRR